MEDKFRIKLKVAGRSFAFDIERDREEVYRRAERQVNDLVAKYKTEYRTQKEDDYLAIAALQLALANVEREIRGSVSDDMDRLAQIERMLSDHFTKNEVER